VGKDPWCSPKIAMFEKDLNPNNACYETIRKIYTLNFIIAKRCSYSKKLSEKNIEERIKFATKY